MRPTIQRWLYPLLLAVQTCAAAAGAAAPAPPGAPAPTVAKPFAIERADPALDAVIAPDAQLKLLGDRFGITEGPVWVPQGDSGYLLVSDLTANAIYRIDPDGTISV